MTDAPAPTPAISVRDLVVQYGERRALDGVSLDVAPGAVVGLLGPNGSGKSTLVSVVAGLRRPQSGEARIGGQPLSAEVRRGVGVVFQQSCLDPLMTLDETLTLHGRLFGLGGAELRGRIEALLGRFDLPSRTKDAVSTLSGGLRRRLELARALLTEPSVLLLDEPTTGLDPDSRRGFWELLRGLRADAPRLESLGYGGDAKRGELTILFATNDVLEAERECDTAAFLHQGKLVTQGTPGELKAGLKHDSVRVECSDGWAAKLADSVVDWPGVGQVTRAESVLHVTVDDVSSFVPRLFQTKPEGIHTIRIEASTLEDAYFALTGASVSKEDA